MNPCGRHPGRYCTSIPCPGGADPSACLRAPRTPPPPAEVLSRVAACPDRGGVLPLSLQPDCDCRGKELSACRAGRGATPGRVTLSDCLACQGGP